MAGASILDEKSKPGRRWGKDLPRRVGLAKPFVGKRAGMRVEVAGKAILSGQLYSCLAAAAPPMIPQATLDVKTTTRADETLIVKEGATLKVQEKIAQTSNPPSDYPRKSMTAGPVTSGLNASVSVWQKCEHWLATVLLLAPTTFVWLYSPSQPWPPSILRPPPPYFSADPSPSFPHPSLPCTAFVYSSSKINMQ